MPLAAGMHQRPKLIESDCAGNRRGSVEEIGSRESRAYGAPLTLRGPGRSGEDVGAALGNIMSFYAPDTDAVFMRRRYNLSGVVTFVTWPTRMDRAVKLLLLVSAVSSRVRDSPDNRAPEAA